MATYGGSSCPNPTRMVTFITSDDKEVKVPVATAMKFRTVRDFFDGDLDRPEVLENAAPFRLLNVESVILRSVVRFCTEWDELALKYEVLENERVVVLPSKYEALERERLFELPSKYQALEKERQEFKAEFFGRLTDETIVELVKAADYLEIKELLDSVMPSFRNRFGFGDDKDADFVYTAEAEAIFRRRAASASEGDAT